MTTVWTLSEAAVRQAASAESFARGRAYCDQGAVVRLARRGEVLEAEVEGSGYAPYHVRVPLTPTGLNDATCTCPYEWGGICKHIVAALLDLLRQPGGVEERPPLDTMLDGLDAGQLRAILLAMAERMPDLVDLIEARVLIEQHQVAAPAAGKAGARERRTPLDPRVYRRQVSAALGSTSRMRSSEAYWQVAGVVSAVQQVAAQARPFIEAGDGRNALVILEAVTEEYMAGWTELYDDEGETADLFTQLDPLWAEAILTADLSLDERKTWAKRFNDWSGELEDYGPEDSFGLAEAAAVQGWDGPWLQTSAPTGAKLTKVLDLADLEEDAADDYEDDDEDDEDEDGDEDEFEDDEANGVEFRDDRWYARELAAVRLRILERQGRIDEYLTLARATGQSTAYLTMLVKQGRADEAVRDALTNLRSINATLDLARALAEHNALDEALRVADHGLSLPPTSLTDDPLFVVPTRTTLARWLRDLAEGAGRSDLALKAAEAAVRESRGLEDYLAAERLAGERWSVLREQLLAHVRGGQQSYASHNSVGILLHEGLIDDAIAIADASPYSYALVEQVADAALKSRPDWVERAAKAQAEPIMDGGKSGHYQDAARWLGKARAAALASGREAEWRSYLDGVLDKHRRKYTLVPLLKPLH